MTDVALHAATAALARKPGFAPLVGIVLGSGLGGIADLVTDATAIPYGDLPGFPVSGVAGHAGRLVLGRLGGAPVAVMQGRVHLYEGRPYADIKVFVRLLKRLGCTAALFTNAAGGLRLDLPPGKLMMVTDHINLLPGNPLAGRNDDAYGERFPSMEGAYDPAFQTVLRNAAARLGIGLKEGVYLGCLGPSFETPAEIRAFARLGADAVGMSTVPEVIVARHCGLRVAAVSVITNLAAGLGGAHGHEQTLAAATAAAGDAGRLIAAFLEETARG